MFEGFEGGLVPSAFVAVTRQVYVFPFVNDETTIGLAVPVAEASAPPLGDVQTTVKLEIRAPPSLPRRNVTEADAGPRVAVPIVGAIGADAANAVSAGATTSNAAGSSDTDTSPIPNALAHCLIAHPPSWRSLRSETGDSFTYRLDCLLIFLQDAHMIAAATRRSNAERSAETQNRLLDATIECLIERGWAGTSTTEIVRRAGVSRGAQVHHFPAKEDLVLAAVEHLLARRIREFQATFAGMPVTQRSPAAAMRLLYDVCFRATFEPWLELAVAARTDPALHDRFAQLESRFFDAALAAFTSLFPDAAADPAFARRALRLTFAVLDGLAIGRMIDTPEDELDAVIDTYNAIAAPYFPQSPGGTS
jgi:AcrR family transcriptional regulator